MTDTKNPASSVLIIDDDSNLCEWALFHLGGENCDVDYFTDATAGLAALRPGSPDVVILDLDLPDMPGLQVLERIKKIYPKLPVIMLTATEDVPIVVQAMNSGAFDYLTKPVSVQRLRLVVRNAVEQHQLQRKIEDLQRTAEDAGTWGLVGRSPVMLELHRSIERIAASDVSVVIHGESGTGKELVARAIHDAGGRAEGPFIAVNCAAIPETLQEDELFGHERGAFTGAHRLRRGFVEQAHGGTLFLDEVAELSAPLQATLLRVLQERTFCRIGGSDLVESDFRLVAATNRDLAAAVASNQFREDLYYRLAVYELELAPLRAMPEDIPELALVFLGEMARDAGAENLDGFDAGAMELLEGYHWPGNVRELRNAVHRGFVASDGRTIRCEDLPPRILASKESREVEGTGGTLLDGSQSSRIAHETTNPAILSPHPSVLPVLDRLELDRAAVVQALNESGGRVDEAARILGVGRTTLYRKRKKYGLL
jgi:DNA-binding NtrC family response regulator